MSSLFVREESIEGFAALVEHLPDTYFFVKDAELRFKRVNVAFAELLGASGPADVIGKRDEDFFPSLSDEHAREDQSVLRSREPVVEKVEAVPRFDGETDWLSVTKLPVLDADGRVSGVCGVARPLSRMARGMDPPRSTWDAMMETMLIDYARPLDTAALAAQVGLSNSQFTRQFRRRYQSTPRAYLINIRMEAARHLLTSTDLKVAEIAIRTGFYDPSHFTNQFVRRYGVSPSRYRTATASQPPLSALTRRARPVGRTLAPESFAPSENRERLDKS